MVRFAQCVKSSSLPFTCWSPLRSSFAPVASAPSPPSPCYSSTSCSSAIAPGNGRPISRPSIASSSPSPRRKPGPKGPSPELIAAIIALKGRNPHFGRVRIAQQITRAFGVEIDNDIVRRVRIASHYEFATHRCVRDPSRPETSLTLQPPQERFEARMAL